MAIEECSSCRFYHRQEEYKSDLNSDQPLHPDDFEAVCRRYPPSRFDEDYFGKLAEMGTLADGFAGPTVNAKGWCGEFRLQKAL